MKLKLATIILSSLFAGAAFADGQDYGTINHHQAMDGHWEVEPIVGMFTNNFKNNKSAAFTNMKQAGTFETVQVEYGINPTMSLGVQLGMLQVNVSGTPDFSTYGLQNPKVSGLMDPNLYMKGKIFDVGGGVLIYGLGLSVGLGPQTQSSTGAVNAANGGTSMTPNVGWEKMFSDGSHLGVNLAYTGYVTDRKVQNSFAVSKEVDETVNGGQHFFIETYYEKFVLPYLALAADLQYSSFASTKTKGTGDFASDDNGNSGLGVGVYASYVAAPNIFIVPVVKYLTAADPSGVGHVQSVAVTNFFLFADFIF